MEIQNEYLLQALVYSYLNEHKRVCNKINVIFFKYARQHFFIYFFLLLLKLTINNSLKHLKRESLPFDMHQQPQDPEYSYDIYNFCGFCENTICKESNWLYWPTFINNKKILIDKYSKIKYNKISFSYGYGIHKFTRLSTLIYEFYFLAQRISKLFLTWSLHIICTLF